MMNKSPLKRPVIIGILIFLILLALLGSALFLNRSKIASASASDPVVSDLKVCHLQNPLGIDEPNPTFSWQLHGKRRGLSQSSYRITVAESMEALTSQEFSWDSGKITASESVGIPYQGEPLKPRQRYFYEITVWDETDTPITSLETAWFETGLMGEGLGDAKWISAPTAEKNTDSKESNSLSYNINYQLTVSNTTAGFIFGANEGRYGTLYLCEIKNTEEQTFFRLKKMDGGSFVSKEEVDITHSATDADRFDVSLSVHSDTLTVTVNNGKVGTFSIDATPVGSIGYYKSRGTSYAYLDDILVTEADGTLIYEDNFANAETIFSPYYVTLEDERLKIGSGLMLTPGYEEPAPLFRKEFTLQDKPVNSARIYMTALGSFTLSVNGKRVSEDYFSPGKLAFNKQLSYVTYDITSLLEQGQDNALGILLLHGWYDRAVGYPEIWNPWGDTNALLGKLEIHYEDGTVEEIVTDESFLCCTDGPVRNDDIYQGEYYDANQEKTGFDLPGYQTNEWLPALENQVDPAYHTLPLTAKKNEPIVCINELTPVSVSEPVDNVFVYDFGQNFAGTCQIKVTGEKGQVITLRYGEALNKENLINKDDAVGTIWTENLLTAEATDYYVMKGDKNGEIFEPEFVFHGFRYLQISGIDEPIPANDIKGLVLSSHLDQTGSFTCSNEYLNQFYQNTINSQQSNFLDNPTDCPQRDERHGWAGDAQVYSLTASYHANTYSFYEKYLEELRLLQTEGGSFTDMAPRNFGTQWDGTGGGATNNCWGDAAVVITWNLYTQYGDKAIIEENYDALCKWMEVLVSTSDNYIRSWGGYGDHLSLEDTPADLSDTAWCAHSADLLSKMAQVLGKSDDATYYQEIYENYKQAWQSQYVLPDGMTLCNTQTSYVLGLAFSLFPEELEAAAANHLITLIESGDYHMKTGFSGIGQLLPALSGHGYTDAAYRLLLQEEAPSLLYQVKQGATTTWELWNGYKEEPDGTYYLDGSFNHYTYGTSAGFLYTDVLGIKSDETAPGYQHILLEPKTSEYLTFAKGSYESMYGTICCEWKLTEKGYQYSFEIPANTTATLILPTLPNDQTYLESGKAAGKAEGVTLITESNEGSEDRILYKLVSGSYCFTVSD